MSFTPSPPTETQHVIDAIDRIDPYTPDNCHRALTAYSDYAVAVAGAYLGESASESAGSALPADVTNPAGTRLVADYLADGDAQPAFRIMGDGRQDWGPGGAVAPDTTITRFIPGVLRVTNQLWAAHGLKANHGDAAEVMVGLDAAGNRSPRILFGSAGDTNLYRTATSELKTDGTMRVGNSVVVDQGDSGQRLYFGSALDVSVTRAGAGQLRVNGELFGTNRVIAMQGAANQIDIGGGSAQCTIFFGSAADTNLYRAAADTLKTDDALIIGGNVGFYGGAATAKQTVSGSKGGNAALASLVTALASYGLIVDSTS